MFSLKFLLISIMWNIPTSAMIIQSAEMICFLKGLMNKVVSNF